MRNANCEWQSCIVGSSVIIAIKISLFNILFWLCRDFVQGIVLSCRHVACSSELTIISFGYDFKALFFLAN